MSRNAEAGILTYHNTANYGAALQAFALLETCKACGVNAEIIDYTSANRAYKYSLLHRILSALQRKDVAAAALLILSTPGFLARKAAFKRFYSSFLKYSVHVGSDKNKLCDLGAAYKSVIVGSDQVWSYTNNGNDSAYLLDFVCEPVKRFSYAASFGMSSIPEEQSGMYTSMLSQFDHISVREASGQRLVQELLGVPCDRCVDPVLLRSLRDWRQVASQSNMFASRKYQLIYFNDKKYWSRICQREYSISIGSFGIGHVLDFNVRIANQVGPVDFVWLIENAEFIHTTSFHAVVFCLIFNKPFRVYLSGHEGRDSRIVDLLERYDLLTCVDTADPERPRPMVKPDFSTFNELSAHDRSRSIELLCQMLETK